MIVKYLILTENIVHKHDTVLLLYNKKLSQIKWKQCIEKSKSRTFPPSSCCSGPIGRRSDSTCRTPVWARRNCRIEGPPKAGGQPRRASLQTEKPQKTLLLRVYYRERSRILKNFIQNRGRIRLFWFKINHFIC